MLALSILPHFLACSLQAPEHPDSTGSFEELAIHSVNVGDDYLISIRLPPGYDANTADPYPLLLQLDVNLGELDEFNVTCGYVSQFETAGQIPACVVAGIGYPADHDVNTMRSRDYTIPMRHEAADPTWTGGAPDFIAFIEGELLPQLEASYHIADRSRRAIIGHSLGGLFTLYYFLEHDDSTPISAYISASPSLWFDGGTIYDSWAPLTARTLGSPAWLFMTVGSLEGPDMVPYFDDFKSRLEGAGFSWLHFASAKNDCGHIRNISPSFQDGINFLFNQGL